MNLDEALAERSYDDLIGLVTELGEDLIPLLRKRYLTNPERRDLVAWTLRATPGGASLAVELLPARVGDEANDLLRVIAVKDVPCPAPELRRLLADDDTRVMAVAVAGMSGHQDLVPELVPLLEVPQLRGAAAIALGGLGATECTDDLVRRLPSLHGLAHQAFVVALEQLGDPAAVPGLLAWLDEAPDTAVFDLHHALVRLTGRDLLLPLAEDLVTWADNVRRTWRTPATGPTLTGPHLEGPTRATFTLDQGLGVVTTDYDPPIPGSSWPRWDKSVQARGHRLYRAGSDCGTCEAFLAHVGWPPDRAIEASAQLRTALADVPELTDDLLTAMTPMLTGLQTGHYQLRTADLDLERVTDPTTSWLVRRQEFREGFEPEEAYSSGVDHFQLRRPMPGEMPAFGVFLPTQPLDDLAADTVDAHRTAIEAGARPAAILLTWAVYRYVEAEYDEQLVFGLVLDGHHKLAAYAQAGIPARAVLVYRLEDTKAEVLDGLTWP